MCPPRLLREFIKRLRSRRLDPTWWINSPILPEDAVVVQIGSNDGMSEDPIHDSLKSHKQWRGLLVEPVPHVFEKLKLNYGTDHRFTFRNVAVSRSTEPSEFYWIDPEIINKIPNSPDYVDKLSSFSR